MQSRCLRALNKTSFASRLSSFRPFSSSNSDSSSSDETRPPLSPPTNIFDTTPSKKPLIKADRVPHVPDEPPVRYQPSEETQADIRAVKEQSVPPRVRFSSVKIAIQDRELPEQPPGLGLKPRPRPRKWTEEEALREAEENEMRDSRLRADPSPVLPRRRIVHVEDEETINPPGTVPELKLRYPGEGDGWGLDKRVTEWLEKLEENAKNGGPSVTDQIEQFTSYHLGNPLKEEIPDSTTILNEIWPLWDQKDHPLQGAPRRAVMEEFKKEFFAENDWPLVSPVYVSDEKKKRMDEVEDYPLLQKLLQKADHSFFNPPDEEAYFRSHDPPEIHQEGYEDFLPKDTKVSKSFPSYEFSCVLWSKARTRKYETGFKQKHTTMIVAGNGKGVGGFGIGKAQTSEEAFEAALLNIEKNLFYVPLFEGRTLPQPVVGQMNETKVIITPMRKGGGLKGADYIHEVFACWGITDCNVKIIGGKNRYSLMYALWDALARQTTLRSEAMRRGINYHRFFVSGHDGDFENSKRFRYPSKAEVKERQTRIDRIFKHAFRIYEERSDDINRQVTEETPAETVTRLTSNVPRYLEPISNRKPYHQK